MKARIKFRKFGVTRFIGHLDLMRTFQKIFRRANIPIAYSEGFNPHQIFSIAAPLGVGIESDGEYLDIKLTEKMPIPSLLKAINNTCPHGVMVVGGLEIGDKEPAAMALVSGAKYIITQKDATITENILQTFLEQKEIIIQKKSKKGKWNDIDIRPGIYNLALREDKIIMTIATGSQLNIKPDVVLKAICDFEDLVYERFHYTIFREEIYSQKNGLTPLEVAFKDGSDYIAY